MSNQLSKKNSSRKTSGQPSASNATNNLDLYIQNVYNKIRAENPGEPCGDHWKTYGAYIGEDMWADPDAVGITGNLEFFVRAYWPDLPGVDPNAY